jgi:hypothetical protein
MMSAAADCEGLMVMVPNTNLQCKEAISGTPETDAAPP